MPSYSNICSYQCTQHTYISSQHKIIHSYTYTFSPPTHTHTPVGISGLCPWACHYGSAVQENNAVDQCESIYASMQVARVQSLFKN